MAISNLAGGGSRLNPMALFRDLKLAIKLPLIISFLGIVVAAALGTTSYLDARAILESEIRDRFLATGQARAEAVSTILDDMAEDLELQSRNPAVIGALASLGTAWDGLSGDRGETLQRVFIDENPHPAGRRDELASTGDGSTYDIVHSKYHPYFRAVVESGGYGDALLVDTDGNVIYSVAKARDFATNLRTGEWQSTGLARAFRAAMDQPAGMIAVFDLAPYAANENRPTGFAAIQLADRSGQSAGAMIVQLPNDRMNEVMQAGAGLGETGQSLILGPDLTFRSASRFDGQFDSLSPAPDSAEARRLFNAEEGQILRGADMSGDPVHSSATHVDSHGIDWAVVVQQKDSEIFAPLTALRNTILIQLGGFSLVVALIGIFVGRAIADPISRAGDRLAGIARGDLASAIPGTDRGDDVGHLARNMEALRASLSSAEAAQAEKTRQAQEQKTVVEHLTGAIRKLAEGNLTVTLATAFSREYEPLREGFNDAVGRLNETMTDLLGSATEIDRNAREVELASNDLSQKAIEQAASLEETAAAITELSASVKSTADSAGTADGVMQRAKSDALSSGQVVNEAMTAMDRISSSSQKISQVTSVIEDLAFQTNLLALNAGVEAARAGEAGRGFAVVASEVRALAQRSSDAAKEINGLIRESADNVDSGVKLVAKAGESFENLIGDFDKVSSSVSSIATAAREQSVGLEEINTAVDQLDGVTQKNAAVATQVHGTGKLMVNEADKLNRISASFIVSQASGRKKRHATAPAMTAPATPASPPARPMAKVAVNAPIALPGAADNDEWAEF